MEINLYNSFESIPADILRNSAAVVIDVFRASTTICTALINGCSKIYPVETVDDAVKLYERLDQEKTFLCGERSGVKIDGFHFGNSPFEYKKELVKNKDLIFTTTNGTYTLLKAKDSDPVVVCGFVNIGTVVKYLKDLDVITILLSGRDRRFSLEDAVCGGMLVNNMLVNNVVQINDGASAALRLYLSVKENCKDCLYNCEHASYLKEIGFETDLEYCLNLNTHDILPFYKDGVIKSDG